MKMRDRIESMADRPMWILIVGVPGAAGWFVVTLLLGASLSFASIGAVTYGIALGVLMYVLRRRRRRVGG